MLAIPYAGPIRLNINLLHTGLDLCVTQRFYTTFHQSKFKQ